MNNEALCDLDALDLSRSIQTRQVSCREVMQAHLSRIQRLNPAVNAIVAMRTEDELIKESDRCDAELARGESRGWMHGFPHAIKDTEQTAGIASTWGSPLLRDHIPSADSLPVARIRAAGAIIIGKTNVPEWAMGSQTYNPVYGTTLNPYDTSRTCGGSSGGAAVSLALRMLPVADGSDLGGSLRNPAGWCNVFGFRPSQSRVPKWPADEVFVAPLGTAGPMARNIPDLMALLATMSGPDARQPLSLPHDASLAPTHLACDPGHWRGVRIGWLGDLGGHLATEPGVLELCQTALSDLAALGCSVEDAPLGFDAESIWNTFGVLRSLGNRARFEAYRADPQKWALIKPESQWEYEQGAKHSGMDVHRALVNRSAWFQRTLELFEQFDYLVQPSAQCFPFPVSQHWPSEVGGRTMDSYHRWMEGMALATLAGLPAISVPAGFDSRGLPMGLQLIGRPTTDLQVLQLAHAYDQATAWVSKRPPAALRQVGGTR